MNRHVPLPTLPSVCPLDCPDTCSLSVRVENNKLKEVRGSRANPYTDNVICNKVARYYPEFVHGEGRLTHPLRRAGSRGDGKFERITWDEALSAVHDGFTSAIAKHGPQTVLPLNYAGPHGELAGGSMDRRFFYHMGATLLNRGPLCGAVRGSAYSSLFGDAPGMPPEQVVHSDLVLVWGNNVTVSNLHLMRVLKKSRAAGARLVVIDPKRTKIAEQCDLFLQIYPGTDVVLAMALAAELERRDGFDREFIAAWTTGSGQFMEQARQYSVADVKTVCGIEEADFYKLAEWFLTASNVAGSIGNGPERGRSGGSGLRAAISLHALTGNHGRPGAGVIAKSGLAAPKTREKLHGNHLIRPGTRTLNIVDTAGNLLNDQLDPPITATMIYNHNPVATHPDQATLIRALMREDLFVVGCDVVMTDSMAFCDIILPAASHFEFDDIYAAYGQNYVQRAGPVIPCVGESLPNTEIFRRLAAKFGYDGPEFQDTDQDLMNQAMDDAHPKFAGTPPSQIALDQAILMQAGNDDDLIMCKTVFPTTKSKKIELYSNDLEERFGFGVPRFAPVGKDRPFVLITPSSDKRTNATFGGCEASQGVEILEMHPEDATARGLSHGDMVTASNQRGQVTFQLSVTSATLQGVVYSPKGTWRKTSRTGLTANALIPSDIRTDIERGACYNETFVDVEKI